MLAAVVYHHGYFLHWLSHFLGLDNLSGPFYGWWSGAGSDLGELAIIGGLVAVYRRHECHEVTCHRLGKHPFADADHATTYQLCRRHHPGMGAERRATYEHLVAAYMDAKMPKRDKDES